MRKAIAAGRITPEADGTIDAERVDAVGAQFRCTAHGTARRAVKVAVQESSGATGDGASSPIGNIRSNWRPLLRGRSTEVVKAQTNKVRLARLGDQDRPQAIAHVFKLARSERDAWLTGQHASGGNRWQPSSASILTRWIAWEAVREHLPRNWARFAPEGGLMKRLRRRCRD